MAAIAKPYLLPRFRVIKVCAGQLVSALLILDPGSRNGKALTRQDKKFGNERVTTRFTLYDLLKRVGRVCLCRSERVPILRVDTVKRT